MAVTARISSKSDQIIKEIEEITGETKIRIIEAALLAYAHHTRMLALNESYQRLKSRKKDWNEEIEERKTLEGSLYDGLEEEG